MAVVINPGVCLSGEGASRRDDNEPRRADDDGDNGERVRGRGGKKEITGYVCRRYLFC